MRDRLLEFLPLLLVGLVLLIFQVSRPGTPLFGGQPDPTPVVEVATQPSSPPRRFAPVASATVVVSLCNPAQLRFGGGIAALKTALGASMGEPLECERAVNSQGDTQQKTTTGLAYYRKELNLACFTNGWDHWSLVHADLVYWSGDAVDPPRDALIMRR